MEGPCRRSRGGVLERKLQQLALLALALALVLAIVFTDALTADALVATEFPRTATFRRDPDRINRDRGRPRSGTGSRGRLTQLWLWL